MVEGASLASLWAWWTPLVFIFFLALVARVYPILDRIFECLVHWALGAQLEGGGNSWVCWRPRQGILSVGSICLSSQAFKNLNIPFYCEKVFIREIELYLSSWKPWTMMCRLSVRGINLSLRCREYPEIADTEELAKKRVAAQKQSKMRTLKAVDSALWGQSPDWRLGPALTHFLKKHVILRIIRAISFSIEDMKIELRCHKESIDGENGPEGGGYLGRAHSSMIKDSVLVLETRSLSSCSTKDGIQDSANVLSCLHLKGLKAAVEWPSPLVGDGRERSVIVQHWSMSMNIKWNMISSASMYSKSPDIAITVLPSALVLSFSERTLQWLIVLTLQIAEYFQFYMYREQRPQTSVSSNPVLWWQHAGRCVGLSLESNTGDWPRCADIQARRAIRLRYARAYRLTHLHSKWSCLSWMSHLTCRHAKAQRVLRELENSFSTTDIAILRWWVWAQDKQWKKGRPGRNLSSKFMEVSNLINMGAFVFQQGTRPPFVLLRATCPKVSLSLVSSTSAHGSCILQTNVIEPRCELIPTLTHSMDLKYQSKRGPYVVNASCKALHVDERPAHADYPDLGDAERISWLLQSPSASSPSKQDFLKVTFVKHPMQLLRPQQLTLHMAPMDVRFSQDTIVQLMHFACKITATVDAKCSALQSARIQAHISSALLERQASPVILTDSSDRLSMEVSVGDIKLYFPCHECDQSSKRHGSSGSPLSFIASGRTDLPSTDRHQAILVFVLGAFSFSTTFEEESQVLPGELRTLNTRYSIFGKGLEGLPKMPRRAPGVRFRHQSQRSALTKVLTKFSIQVFLGDAKSLTSAREVTSKLKVLEPVNVTAKFWNWVDTTAMGLEQHIQVELRISSLCGYLTPFACREVCSLLSNISQALEKCDENLVAWGSRASFIAPQEAINHKPGIKLNMLLDMLIPDATLRLVRATSLEDSIVDGNSLGSIEIKNIQAFSDISDMEQSFRFTLGTLGIFLEEQRPGCSEHVVSRTVALIRPVPFDTLQLMGIDKNRQIRAFRAWRAMAQKQTRMSGRKEYNSESLPQHPQFSGQILRTGEEVTISITSNFVVMALDHKVLDSCMNYFGIINEALKGYTSRSQTLNRAASHPNQESTGFRSEIFHRMSASRFRIVQQQGLRPVCEQDSSQSSQATDTHRAVTFDFGIGCLHVSLSADDKPIATVIGSDVQGNLMAQESGEMQLRAEFSDINVIDRQSTSDPNKMILDGSCRAFMEDDSEECRLSLVIITQQQQGTLSDRTSSDAEIPEDAPAHSIPTMLSPFDGGEPDGLDSTVPRTLVRVKCTNIHIVWVSRFFKDFSFLADQMLMRGSCQQKQEAGTTSAAGYLGSGGLLVEVLLESFQIDVPRCSWSGEFLSLTGKMARILLPSSSGLHDRALQFIGMHNTFQESPVALLGDPKDKWEEMRRVPVHSAAALDSDKPQLLCDCKPLGAGRQSTSQADPFQVDQELLEDFEMVSSGRLSCLLDGIVLCSGSQSGYDEVSGLRQVLEGQHAVFELDMETWKAKAWWPELYCILGEPQFSLLMGVLWGNLVEDSTCTPPTPPQVPIGETLPGPPPQPEQLGVEESLPTMWSLEILFSKAWFLFECELETGVLMEIGQVGFAGTCLRVEQYECSSIRTQIMSEAFLLQDNRFKETYGSSSDVISVCSTSERCVPHLIKITTTSTLRWQDVVQSLGESMHEASRPPHGPSRRHSDASSSNWTSRMSGKEVGKTGLVFDYVYHGIPPDAQPGPQVVELVLLGADISWPYLSDSSFSSPLSTIFTTYFFQSWCAPNPPPALDQWVYMNFILEDSQASANVPNGVGNWNADVPDVVLWWNLLRCGYFWGGDGEVRLKLNWDELQADSGARSHRRALLDPVSGTVSMRWLHPKCPAKKSSTHVDVSLTDISAILATRHIPALQNIIQGFQPFPRDSEELKAEGESSVVEGSTPSQSVTKIGIEAGSIKCVLMDDTNGHNTNVLEASLNNLKATGRCEELSPEKGMVMLGTCRAELLIDYMNNGLESMESLVESWPFCLEYRKNGCKQRVIATSDAKLNLLVTPASFASFRDAGDFVGSLLGYEDHLPTHPKPEGWAKPCSDDGGLACRLYNISGMRCNYWTDMPDGPSASHALQSDEDAPLALDPPEKMVMMSSTRQQVRVKTICIQFEGNWSPIVDIVVNKVGKYVYELRSQLETVSLPIIVDVNLQDRTKVVTIHSMYHIQNHTNINMDFRVNVFSSHGHRSGNRSRTMGTSMRVPRIGVLASMEQCYLPIQASLGALLYLKASDGTSDFQRAEKDVIRLCASGSDLKDQQGMYTCPSLREGIRDFHCCLEVQEVSDKTVAIGFEPGMDLVEYALVFHPPISVQNLLPNTITVKISEAPFLPSADVMEMLIASGESISLYELDFCKMLRIKVEMEGFTAYQAVEVLSAPKYFRQKYCGPVTRDILLTADSRPTILPGEHKMHGKSLKLKVHHHPIGQSSARKVMVYSAYWVINKANIPLELRDTKPATCPQVTALPVSDNLDFPVLFTSAKGTMRIGIDAQHWSKSINLDTLGIKRSFSVLGPVAFGKDGSLGLENHSNVPKHGDSNRSGSSQEAPSSTASTLPNVPPGAEDELSSVAEETVSEENVDKSQPKHSCYEFTVAVSLGPSLYERTKVVTITPRFLFVNYSSDTLAVVQQSTDRVLHVKSRDSLAIHWHNADGRREVCLRPCGGNWSWSGSFRLDEVNNFGMKVRHRHRDSFKILPVDISDKGDSMVCIIHEEYTDPPYRIENRCMGIVIRCRQHDVRTSYESIEPGHSMGYAWDEPCMPHRLKVMIDASNIGIEELRIQDYNLDNIKAHPTLILGRKLKAVGALVATMGRRAKNRLDRVDQTSPLTRHNTDPEIARVFVHVFADGGTRVLRFSDMVDSMVPTTENNLALLSKKIEWLKQSIMAVDKELESFADVPGMMWIRNSNNSDKLASGVKLLRKSSGLGRQVRVSLSRGGASASTRSSIPEEGPTESPQEINPENSLALNSSYRTQSQDSKSPFLQHSSGGKIRQLLRRVSGLQLSIGEDGVDIRNSDRTEEDGIPSWVQSPEGTVRSLSGDKRQSGVFENVVSQFAGKPIKSIMRRSHMDGSVRECSRSSFEISAPSAVQGTQCAKQRPSTSTITSVDVLETATTSETTTEEQRRSGLIMPFVDPPPSIITSVPREGLPLADLASFSIKVKNKRRARAQLPELLGMKGVDSLLADEEEILGGELVVKVIGAQNIVGSTGVCVEGRTGLGARLGQHSGSGKGLMSRLTPDMEVYCVLKCEGQERRTPKVPVSDEPKWNHELHFHAVPVCSHLVVTVLGKNMIISEVFLGEVVIPLVEIEDMVDPKHEDTRAYTLGRRRGKEKVSGEVLLTLAWRVTPLDRLTLKIKALQEEFEDRNELLALLKARAAGDWCNPALCVEEKKSDEDGSLPHLMQTACLEVKVIEARNLVMPFERLRHHNTMNAFAVVTCERQTGHFSHHTSVQKNKRSPRWNASFSFKDVDASSSLIVQVFDKKNLRANDFLGQVVLPIMTLKDSRPHYAWYPLQPRGPKGHRVGGDVRLRLRWCKSEMWDEDAESSGITFDLNLGWIGVSVVEACAQKMPREIMHILLDRLAVNYRRSGLDESFRFVLQSIQIDNQLITSMHPVAFCQSLQTPQETLGARTESSDSGSACQAKPILEICLEKLNQNAQTRHVRYFTVLLQEVDIVLEKHFLDIVLHWYDELPLNDLLGSHSTCNTTVSLLEELLHQPSCAELAEEHIRSSGVRWYFEVLHIQPIKVNITLLPSPGREEGEMSRRYRIASSLGINLLDVANMPLKINAMILKNAFMQPRELLQQISRHMMMQILRDVHKILGSVELLGTPVKLGSSIIAGVASFFYEPAKGIVHGPEEFAKGLATGTVNLIKNSMAGVCSTLGQVTEGFGKTLAALSMDDHYYQKFRSRQLTNTEKFFQGTQILGWGCMQGITGVVMDPIMRAEREGAVGLVKGCATGIAGLITKPTSGVLGFASKTVSGIGGGIRSWGDEGSGQRRRVRPPRDFGICGVLEVDEAGLKQWKEFITTFHNGKFREDVLLDVTFHNNKVLLITSHRLMYLNHIQKVVKWIISTSQIVAVSTMGLDIILRYHYIQSLKSKQVFSMLARKRIVCATSDMQHVLLVKINHHLERIRIAAEGTTCDEIEPQAVDDGYNLKRFRIMNAAPPTPGPVSPMSNSGPDTVSDIAVHGIQQEHEEPIDLAMREKEVDGTVDTSSIFVPPLHCDEKRRTTTFASSQVFGGSDGIISGRLPVEENVSFSRFVTSMSLIASSVTHPTSDREVTDALASIGQLAVACLSLPILSDPSMHTIASLITTVNRLCFDGPRDGVAQAVQVLCETVLNHLRAMPTS